MNRRKYSKLNSFDILSKRKCLYQQIQILISTTIESLSDDTNPLFVDKDSPNK